MNLRDFNIGTRLMATTFGALALMVLFVLIALFSLDRIGSAADRIVDVNNRKMELSVELRMRNLLVGRHLRTALLRDDKQKVAEEHAKIRADMDKAVKAEESLLPLMLTADERSRLQRMGEMRKVSDASMEKAIALLMADQKDDGKKLFFDDTRPRLQEWFDSVGEVVKEQKDLNAKEVLAIDSLRDNTRNLLLGLIVLAVLVMVPAGGYVVGLITRPLRHAVEVADAVAADKLDNIIEQEGRDEVSALMRALKAMQDNLLERTASERRVAQENLRIRFALESVTMPVTLSDDANKLVFMNRAATDLWQGMAGEISRRVPGFSVNGMLGTKVGGYLEDEAVIAAYRSPMKETRVFDMGLAGRRLRVIASPVHDYQGGYQGRLSQWLDRTAEVAVESEVSAMVDAAAHGDFSRRLALEGKSGFYLRVSQGLNKLTEEVARGLEDVGRVLNAIAQGSLTERVDGQYEGTFGRLVDDTNTTVSRLQEVVGRIKDATEAINLAAREIAQGNSDLSSRTEEQASSLEETASSMEEINATVKQNAENARQAKNLAAGSHDVVQRSGQMVGQVVDTMAGIADSSRKMSDIIGVIDSIAFQTNILALNAAVEAARAGEQGRGFAVVATEVRALAQRSATAAREIKVLIAASVDKVENGVQLVQETGRTMGEVVASFQKVAALVTEIASASVEQSSGVEQVTLAVGQMDEVTQQNAALVEQAAAAAESLEEQAQSLSKTVSVFRLAAGDLPAQQPSALSRRAPATRPAAKTLPRAKPGLPAPSGRSAAPQGMSETGSAKSVAQDEWEEF